MIRELIHMADASTPRLRWFQYRLRTLLLFVPWASARGNPLPPLAISWPVAQNMSACPVLFGGSGRLLMTKVEALYWFVNWR